MKKIIRATLMAASIALLAAMTPQVMAHGGEDHGGGSAALPDVAMAPRAVAQSEEFELVAVVDGGQLMVTLDRFATNEPVPDAQIEIDSGAHKTIATQIAPGTYAIAAGHFVSPGAYPLTISIETPETADLLTATLEIPITVAAGGPPADGSGLPALGAKGWLLFAGAAVLALLAIRRYRSSRSS